jgi:hypothetical protein
MLIQAFVSKSSIKALAVTVYTIGLISPTNMTGTTFEGDTIFTNAPYGFAGYEAWRAFDGQFGSESNLFHSGSDSTHILGYTRTTASTVTSYSIYSRTNWPAYPRYPTTWTLEGTNDSPGSNGASGTGTVLDTRSSQTFTPGQVKTFSVNTSQSFKSYRLRITGNSTDGNIVIEELKVFGF